MVTKSFKFLQVFMEDPGLLNREKICSKSKFYMLVLWHRALGYTAEKASKLA